MRNAWSMHAKAQLRGIIRAIAKDLSREDASRWNRKIKRSIKDVPSFPELGGVIPEDCYWTLPANHERLRQTLCNPYRIIYEHVEDEIHVLAVMDCAMLIRTRDTYWN